MSHVNFERLREFDKLFENRREAFVVATLGVSGPLRFSELAFSVQGNANVRVPDSTITQILARLRRAGLIEKTNVDGHDAYTLTEAGARKAWVISRISHALDHHGPGSEPAPAGTA